jgi:alpha-2-macroglobulin
MKNRLPFLLILLTLLSCGPKPDPMASLNPEEDLRLLSQHFAMASTGVISTRQPLSYLLHQPVEGELSEENLQKVISLKPAVKGKVTLQNRSLLTFTPDKPLKPDTDYRIRIDLDALKSPNHSSILEYTVRTMRQFVQMDTERILIEENGSITLTAGVRTADGLDTELLLSCFKPGSAQMDLETVGDRYFLVHFTFPGGWSNVKPIPYDLTPLDLRDKGELSFPRPRPDAFEVLLTHYDVQEKLFHVFFSQPIDQEQDLTGLVTLDGVDAYPVLRANQLSVQIPANRDQQTTRLEISQYIRSIQGKILDAAFIHELDNRADQPGLDFLREGHYLPSSKDFKIPVKARGLKSARISVVEIPQERVPHLLIWNQLEYMDAYTLRMYGKVVYEENVRLDRGETDKEGWSVYGIDLSGRIQKKPGHIYYISMDFGPADVLLPCSEKLVRYDYRYKIPGKSYFQKQDAYYYDYDYGYYDEYDYRKNQDPCEISFYTDKVAANRVFICSDYSIIAKKAGSNYHIALSDLLDLTPVQSAEITLYDLQGEACGTGKSDAEGMVVIPSEGRDAYAISVQKGKHMTFLSLKVNEVNELTEFDVSGDRNEEGLAYFIYTDRGVYRPGDSIFLNLMINYQVKSLPDGLPIRMRLYNMDNHIVDEQIQSAFPEKSSIYSFRTKTATNAKTGSYRCVFSIGPDQVSKNLKIETIRPNTTAVSLNLQQATKETVYASSLSGSLVINYLTGFPVPNANIRALGSGKAIINPFPAHSGFRFHADRENAARSGLTLFEAKTDENGRASFKSPVDFKSFGQPLTLSLDLETSLPGGGVNKEGQRIQVSPFTSYVGLKAKPGKGWSGNYLRGESATIDLVSLDQRGKLQTVPRDLKYTVFKHRQFWWVDKYTISQAGQYVNQFDWISIDEGSMRSGANSRLTLSRQIQDKGTYRILVQDVASGHEADLFFTVYEQEKPIPGLEPHFVEFDLSADACESGQSIQMKLPPIKGARALVSIEKGNQILEQSWVTLSDKETTHTLKPDDSWAPNAYVHLSVIQPYAQENNDLPLRMYAVKNVKVTPKETPLQPSLVFPAKMESDKPYDLEIKEKEGRVMDYTIALVDEGLLSLTGFKTPDPVQHFGGKFPLLVKTWDIYKYLMQYFKARYAGIISIGGDDAYHPDALPQVNRFKPVVQHLGPFRLAAGGKQKHRIQVSGYIGKLRVMVIASNGQNQGKLEQWVEVKNPLMLQSVFPRSLNISDLVHLPVNIFKDNDQLSEATLKASATPGMVSGLNPSVRIPMNGLSQTLHMYKIKVLDKAGKLTVDLSLEGGGKTMKERTELAVNYPNPFENRQEYFSLEPGEEIRLEAIPAGFPETYSARMLLAKDKMPDVSRYADQLQMYPYGCLEQITSHAIVQMYLDRFQALEAKDAQRRKQAIEGVIQRFAAHRMSDGRLASWPSGYYHAWSDLYAGNFLTEAVKTGYLSEKNALLTGWIGAQARIAATWKIAQLSDQNLYESESMIQAYRLWILSKSGKPAKSALNVFSSSNQAKNPIVWYFIAGAYKLAGYDSKAGEYLNKGRLLWESEPVMNFHYGNDARNMAIITEILSYFPDQQKTARQIYDRLIDLLHPSAYQSTQTMGYAVIAAHRMLKETTPAAKAASCSIDIAGNVTNKTLAGHAAEQIAVKKADWKKPISIRNTGKSRMYVTLWERFVDKELEKPAVNQQLELTATYSVRGKPLNGQEIRQGDDVDIKIRVQNKTAVPQEDLALAFAVPSGMELLNPAFYASMVLPGSGAYTHQEYRDDRVHTFFSLPAYGSVTYAFKAKAAWQGDFYFPAVKAEHMYQGDIYARTKTSRIKILAQK